MVYVVSTTQRTVHSYSPKKTARFQQASSNELKLGTVVLLRIGEAEVVEPIKPGGDDVILL